MAPQPDGAEGDDGRDRVLLLGGTGILGRALVDALGPQRCVVTGHRRLGPGIVGFDALLDDPGRLMDDLGPLKAVFLMFGMTSPDACARQPEVASRLNVQAMGQAIQAAVARNLRPIFLSSEVVYDGEWGGYREDARPAPLMLYGRQKLETEALLEATGAPILIVRCARVVGAQPGDGTLVTDLLERLRRGETVGVATDQRFSPILDVDAATALRLMLEREATGIVNLGGREAVTRFEIAQRCHARLAALGIPGLGSVQPNRMRDFPTPEPRPRDVSLNIDKLVSITKWRPANVEEIIDACLKGGRFANTPDENEGQDIA